MEIVSTSYITKNENGQEEICFDYEYNPWDRFCVMLKKFTLKSPKRNTESWVATGLLWVNKETGIKAEGDMQWALFQIKGYFKSGGMKGTIWSSSALDLSALDA